MKTILTCQTCEYCVDPEKSPVVFEMHCNKPLQAFHLYGFLKLFKIFYEEADSDDEKVFRCFFLAETGGQALQLASEYLEVPSHDLVEQQVIA